MERTKVVAKDETYDKLHFDYTKKYVQAEQDLLFEKTVSKEYCRLTDITQPKSDTVKTNAMIIRNYNDGRHGGWNNYCCYKGKNTGSYVQPYGLSDSKGLQHQAQIEKIGEEALKR